MTAPEVDLERRVLELLGAPLVPDTVLDPLAVELWRYQVRHCEHYRDWCEALAVLPETVTGYRAVPALPQEAWKLLRVSTVPASRVTTVFRSSGTTGQGRSRNELPSTTLYERSLLGTFRDGLLVAGAPPREFHALLPSPDEAPDSSLVFMVERAGRAYAAGPVHYHVVAGQLRLEPLQEQLAAATEPVLLLGTAFSLVHLLEALAESPLTLPPGTRVMETGGYKGRARELPRDQLLGRIQHTLGVPPRQVIGQYGMCETSTQFYDEPAADPPGKRVPPWARVLVLDPRTCEPVPPGEPGLLQIHDPANLWTCAAILTGDLGVQVAPDRFQVLGRAPGAPPRGCSLTHEDLETAS
jgi:hypothetical protein